MSKVVLITGASRGIGAASALRAAESGYRVGINYVRDADAAEAVAQTVRDAGAQALTVQADVAVEEDVLRMFQSVQSSLGPIDALVNNVGVLFKQCRLEDMDAARMQRVLAVNVMGALLCAREAVRRMSTRRGGAGGAIVNVSSVAARIGGANEYIDYAVSKGAMDTLTLGLAREVAEDGIRVNAVLPGLIYTDIHASGGEPGRVDRLASMVPMQRGGDAREVANTILWLLSEEASYVTGALVDVAGGR